MDLFASQQSERESFFVQNRKKRTKIHLSCFGVCFFGADTEGSFLMSLMLLWQFHFCSIHLSLSRLSWHSSEPAMEGAQRSHRPEKETRNLNCPAVSSVFPSSPQHHTQENHSIYSKLFCCFMTLLRLRFVGFKKFRLFRQNHRRRLQWRWLRCCCCH